MKVAYIGNYRHSWCTEVHLAATMESLGIEVLRLQEDELSVASLERQVRDYDVLLYTRTWGVKERERFIKLLDDLRGSDTKSASYHLDLYYGIPRQKTLDGDPFWMTEYVFTPDGDPEAQQFFEGQGINHHYVRPGVYKPECVKGNVRTEFQKDVVFVGSVEGYHREWPYRQKLYTFLSRKYKNRFGKFGHPEMLVRGQDLNDLYASAKVVVGDSLCPGFQKPYYWSDRVYETTGRGGFLIHPYIKGLEDEFTDREDIVFYDFNDFNQLKRLIDYYLEHDEEREAIRDSGMRKTSERYTYTERLTYAFQGVMGLEI